MEFLQGVTGQAFALTAGLAGAFAGIGLFRDMRAGMAPGAGREALIAPLGLMALIAAFAAGAGPALRLLAGALLMTGLALMALASRDDRTAPGRRVGMALGWAAIAAGFLGAFLPDASAPDSPV